MARFLAKKLKADDTGIQGAIADAEGADAAAQAPHKPEDVSAASAAAATDQNIDQGAVSSKHNAAGGSELVQAEDSGPGFRRVPSKGSQGSDGLNEDESYPPPPPEDEDDSDVAQLPGPKKNLKHDPSRERRRIAFDIEPRSLQRWKGLGVCFCEYLREKACECEFELSIVNKSARDTSIFGA